jgi:hypothetical protein
MWLSSVSETNQISWRWRKVGLRAQMLFFRSAEPHPSADSRAWVGHIRVLVADNFGGPACHEIAKRGRDIATALLMSWFLSKTMKHQYSKGQLPGSSQDVVSVAPRESTNGPDAIQPPPKSSSTHITGSAGAVCVGGMDSTGWVFKIESRIFSRRTLAPWQRS